jgi:hypothetical protein
MKRKKEEEKARLRKQREEKAGLRKQIEAASSDEPSLLLFSSSSLIYLLP